MLALLSPYAAPDSDPGIGALESQLASLSSSLASIPDLALQPGSASAGANVATDGLNVGNSAGSDDGLGLGGFDTGSTSGNLGALSGFAGLDGLAPLGGLALRRSDRHHCDRRRTWSQSGTPATAAELGALAETKASRAPCKSPAPHAHRSDA